MKTRPEPHTSPRLGDQIWHITWSVRRAGEQDQLLNSETDRATSEQRLEYNVTRVDDSAALVCRARTTTGDDLNAEVGLKIACKCHIAAQQAFRCAILQTENTPQRFMSCASGWRSSLNSAPGWCSLTKRTRSPANLVGS